MIGTLSEKEIDELLETITDDDDNNGNRYDRVIDYLKNKCIINGKGLKNITIEYKYEDLMKHLQLLKEDKFIQTRELIKYKLLSYFLTNYKNKLKEVFTNKFEESIKIIDSNYDKDIDKYLVSRYENEFISIKFTIDPAFIYDRTQIDNNREFFENIMEALYEYLNIYKKEIETELPLPKGIPTFGFHFPNKISKELFINNHQFRIDISY